MDEISRYRELVRSTLPDFSEWYTSNYGSRDIVLRGHDDVRYRYISLSFYCRTFHYSGDVFFGYRAMFRPGFTVFDGIECCMEFTYKEMKLNLLYLKDFLDVPFDMVVRDGSELVKFISVHDLDSLSGFRGVVARRLLAGEVISV